MPYCRNCGGVFPNFLVIARRKRNLSKRKFCLDCSPFGANNRKDLALYARRIKPCPLCCKDKAFEHFYLRRDGRPQTYCKDCANQKSAEYARQFKQQCVEYKGGRCEICGYSRCLAALVFHHREPEKKDFGIATRKRAKRFDSSIKRELDKCRLLCRNCHAELHVELDASVI